MARKMCIHPVFTDLRTKLSAANITVCPTCLLRLHTFEIAKVQSLLEHRGGVFASKASAIAEQEGHNPMDMAVHKALVKRWRLVKIALYRDLSLLEDLRNVGPENARWKIQLDKAFEFWREIEIECSGLASHNYREEDGFPTSKDQSDVQRDVDFEFRLNEGPVQEASDEEFKEWQTIKPRGRTVKEYPYDSRASPASVLGSTEVRSKIHTEKFGSNLAAQSRHIILVSRVTDGLPSATERGSNWCGRNRYDLLRVLDTKEDLSPSTRMEDHKLLSLHPYARQGVTDLTTQLSQLRSSLKRKRWYASSATARASVKVQLSDRVTVICDASAYGTARLPPEQSSFTRAHLPYITAETARIRRKFHRCSSLYVPSTWAMSDDYVNVDTSHFKTPWAQYNLMKRWDVSLA